MSKAEGDEVKLIKTHLEFLGYSTEVIKDDNGAGVTIFTTHDSKANITVRVSGKIIFIWILWAGLLKKALQSKDFHQTLNRINAATAATKWYYIEPRNDDDSKTITYRVEALLHDYDKQAFGTLLDSVEQDSRTYNQELLKFLEE
jgi:putative sensory transduction regulator